ncbi:MAG: hypothetical protein IPP29_09975 [Bacteroidetes bacterium]|nr:hypothetical protein [Bacteroidota bacterium]
MQHNPTQVFLTQLLTDIKNELIEIKLALKSNSLFHSITVVLTINKEKFSGVVKN